MSTTLLPFLYQTPTLRLVLRAGSRALVRRAFHHSDKPFKRRSRGGAKSAIPFELPADYDGNPDQPRWPIGTNDPKKPGTITPNERQAFERIFEEISARGKATSPVPADTTLPSISPNIEATNAIREDADASDDAQPIGPRNPFSVFSPKAEQEDPDPRAGLDAINIIIQDAAQKQSFKKNLKAKEANKPFGNKPFGNLHPLQTISDSKDRGRALLRFPPSLRKAARLALGIDAEQESGDKQEEVALDPGLANDFVADTKDVIPGTDVELGPGPPSRGATQVDPLDLGRTVSAEVTRQRERKRVEKLMDGAQSDFELWDVMEQEVFPMIQKLGLGEDRVNGGKSKGKYSKSRKDEKEKQETDKAETKDGELSIRVHGPLYPSFLLYGLRNLDQKFARSSPLALNILPRVKELGLSSYVLGVSAPFYNTLAAIYWYRYGDATAALNLFEEMRAAGLFLDEDSHGIVNNIDQELGKYSHRFRDEFADAPQEPEHPFLWKLMKLPDYRMLLPRTSYWMRQAGIHIEERQRQLGI